MTCERQREEVRVRMRENRENKIMFLVLQLSYSTILHLESHCSTIVFIIIIIIIFYNSYCRVTSFSPLLSRNRKWAQPAQYNRFVREWVKELG